MDVLSAGTLEAPISESVRNGISVKALRTFDACMQGQYNYARNLVAQSVNMALAGSSGKLAKSDVMASIKELSVRVKQSTAKDRIVFIVSDMLENSSVSSFYAAQSVRLLDASKELAKAESAGMIGDFGGARVFVLGAGIVPEAARGTYRDPKTMAALKDFWQQMLEKSNAQLMEFGAPALISPVQ